MELVIKTLDDLKKLEGWKIEKAEITVGPVLTLQVSHIAAEKPIKLHVFPGIALGTVEGLTSVNPILKVKTEDVETPV